MQVDVGKATGCDEVSPLFICLCSKVLVKPIVAIVNMSIKPIPKVNSPHCVSQYRPISILPVLSKILERTIKDQTISHLLEYSLLSPFQAGFRPGFSTQDVPIYITDKWKKAIDDKQVSGAVFLDVAKAFDCVNHDILLSKLPYYGNTGMELK